MKTMTSTVALIALICIVFLGSGADKNSKYVRTFGAAWRHIYLLALCSRNARHLEGTEPNDTLQRREEAMATSLSLCLDNNNRDL